MLLKDNDIKILCCSGGYQCVLLLGLAHSLLELL
jgi:hypothetical protein